MVMADRHVAEIAKQDNVAQVRLVEPAHVVRRAADVHFGQNQHVFETREHVERHLVVVAGPGRQLKGGDIRD